jgi:hypothetical protein
MTNEINEVMAKNETMPIELAIFSVTTVRTGQKMEKPRISTSLKESIEAAKEYCERDFDDQPEVHFIWKKPYKNDEVFTCEIQQDDNIVSFYIDRHVFDSYAEINFTCKVDTKFINNFEQSEYY